MLSRLTPKAPPHCWDVYMPAVSSCLAQAIVLLLCNHVILNHPQRPGDHCGKTIASLVDFGMVTGWPGQLGPAGVPMGLMVVTHQQ